jgi:hypothetical protein
MRIFGGLFLLSSVPEVPGEDKPIKSADLIDGKPSRRLTKAEREKFTLTAELREITVGLMLGDLYTRKRSSTGNVSLEFEQSTIHKDYLEHLYKLFESYCLTGPKVSNLLPDKRTGKIYSRVRFKTYSLPCFNELHDLFYPLGKKIVPLNIGELLTALALAYLICDDGSWNKTYRRVVLCTNSFTLEEVELLIEALNKNFNLRCYKCRQGTGYIIIIPSYSIPRLQSLLAPHMPTMMRHKIGL